MAELLSAGVYIEEVPSSAQVIQSVSTSNMGIVGFSPRGPTDRATLITSFEQYGRVFGGLTKNSLMGHSVAAFYANGGRRAFVVRVVPSDATAASGRMRTTVANQQLGVGGAGNTTFAATADDTDLRVNDGSSALVPGAFTVRWRGAAAPVPAGATSVTLAAGRTAWQGRVTGALPPPEPGQFVIVPGSATVRWGAVSVAVGEPPEGSTVAVVNDPAGTVTFDYATGIFSLALAAAGTGPVTVAYTPTTATHVARDNGAGVLLAQGTIGDATGTVLTGPGTIGYDDGAYSFTPTVAPHDGASVTATYSVGAWDLTPTSKGVWGNGLRVDVRGNLNYYVASESRFLRHDVFVSLLNEATGNFEVQETYEELVFDDPDSPVYFPDVINELSDLIRVGEPGADLPPSSLSGLRATRVIAGGDGDAAGRTISTTLGRDIARRSVEITYTRADGSTATIQDNGKGGLTGNIDPTQAATVDYATGALRVTLATPARGGTAVTARYNIAPTASGDATLFAGGSDGTFTDDTYSRAQFTDPTAKATFSGLYALSKIDEIMQVVVPDFAGDPTVTGDLLDYAEERSLQPSGGDRFIILTTPKGLDAQDAVDWFRFTLGRFSRFAALYWPWVKVADPLSNGRNLTMPPLGHIAGIYARTDTARNVGKAPGGVSDGALRFLTGLEFAPTQGDRDYVYPNRINPLISSPQTGLAVWGVRTIAIESEWRYINARRLFMFLEKSVFNSTHWVVFENNGPALWSRIKTQLTGWMTSLFNEGYFAGTSPKDAYFVIVDESNNPPNVVEQGQVIIDVGAAPNRPAEFARFRFQQKSLGA